MLAAISEQVKKFLEKPNFAVLATQSKSGRIQATPVWFLHDGGEILINTSAGRKKLRNLPTTPGIGSPFTSFPTGCTRTSRPGHRKRRGPPGLPQ